MKLLEGFVECKKNISTKASVSITEAWGSSVVNPTSCERRIILVG